MNIDKDNFEMMLAGVCSSIDDCDFIAFDMEFTGLNAGKDKYKFNLFDSIDERYMKWTRTSSNFMPTQFGLCLFKQNTTTLVYDVTPYNFYIYPQVKKNCEDTFHCQISCLQFLSNQGFDFNRWLGKGITWTKDIDINIRKGVLIDDFDREVKYKAAPDNKPPAKFREMLTSSKVRLTTLLESSNPDDEVVLNTKNAHERMVVHKHLKPNYQTGDKWLLFQSIAATDKMRVTKSTKDIIFKKRKEKLRDDIITLEGTSGFCQIIKRISASKKPLIGHNISLDLIHTINRFICKLPETLADYRLLVQFMFSRIFDTKYICNNSMFKDFISNSTLANILKRLKEKPFTMPEINFPTEAKYDLENEKMHEAGYDAFITGVAFIAFATYLNKKHTSSALLDLSSPTISIFYNKINIMRIYDVCYLDFKNKTEMPNRDHVFYTTFPKEVGQSDIQLAFKQFGDVFISWINDNSAYASLFSKDQTQNVLKKMERNRLFGSHGIKVMTLNEQKKRGAAAVKPRADAGDAHNMFKTMYNVMAKMDEIAAPKIDKDIPGVGPGGDMTSDGGDITSAVAVAPAAVNEDDGIGADHKRNAVSHKDSPPSKKTILSSDNNMFDEVW